MGNENKLITDLLSYRDTVLELHRSNGNFAKYDQLFRRYVQNSGLRCYNVRLTDLYQRCSVYPRAAGESNQPGASTSQSSQSVGICRRFQEGTCTFKNCRYAHRCQKCNYASHGSKNCKVQAKRIGRIDKASQDGNPASQTANTSTNRQTGNLFGRV